MKPLTAVRSLAPWGILGGALLAGWIAPAWAQPGLNQPLTVHPTSWEKRRPTLVKPFALALPQGVRNPNPQWGRNGLWLQGPINPTRMGSAVHVGIPAYDPKADAWFVSADGVLVRVDGDGRLPVVAHGVQGLDVDVRFDRGVAVSREPDDTITLHRFGNGPSTRHVLMSGPMFFRPRFSPDGSRILVSESRKGGGHTWLVTPDNAPLDLGEANDAAWLPDGRNVVFIRVEHDGHSITATSLWIKDVDTGHTRQLTRSTTPLITKPAVSLDARWLSFTDASTGQVMVAAFPSAKQDRR